MLTCTELKIKYYGRALLSVSEGVTRLARAGRMTCRVRRDFKIITDELSRVSRQFHWWHRTFGDLRFVPQNLYIRKQVRRFWKSWRQLSKQARQRFQGPDPSYPVCYDLSVRVCQQPALTHTAPPRRGREKKNVTKMNFSSCNDHSPKWIINDCYIFFPYLQVWVFLFLRTSFFKAQHVGPMLHSQHLKERTRFPLEI